MHMYEAYIQSGPLLLTSMQCHHHQIKGTVTHKLFQIILVQSALSWRPLLMSNHFL